MWPSTQEHSFVQELVYRCCLGEIHPMRQGITDTQKRAEGYNIRVCTWVPSLRTMGCCIPCWQKEEEAHCSTKLLDLDYRISGIYHPQSLVLFYIPWEVLDIRGWW